MPCWLRLFAKDATAPSTVERTMMAATAMMPILTGRLTPPLFFARRSWYFCSANSEEVCRVLVDFFAMRRLPFMSHANESAPTL